MVLDYEEMGGNFDDEEEFDVFGFDILFYDEDEDEDEDEDVNDVVVIVEEDLEIFEL